MQVLPGTHCLKCHMNYGGTFEQHYCKIKTATECDDSCKAKLLTLSDEKSWIDNEMKIINMEQAIKKAIEGGWKPGLVTDFSVLDDESWIMVIHQAGYKWVRSDWVFDNSIFLDPLFWQALGKALGWKEYSSYCTCHSCGNDTCNMYTWLCNMHRFIDHLAEGKDAESFFNELLK